MRKFSGVAKCYKDLKIPALSSCNLDEHATHLVENPESSCLKMRSTF